MKLSILIPVYNEKYTLEQVVDEVLRVPLPVGVDREVVIVDDCSTDGTTEVVRHIHAAHPEIQCIRHEQNQGKGAAVRTAVHAATGDIIVCQDADLEYSPADYGKMLAPILAGDADAVFGSRFLTSECHRVLYFWHSVGNRFLTLLSNALTDLNLTDMETCYKMVRADILKSIPIRSDRFGIEPELTAKLAKRGCRIYEVPVSYRGRTYQEGKKITWWDGVKAFFVMLYFKVVDDLYDTQYDQALRLGLCGTHHFFGWLGRVLRPHIGETVLELGAGLGSLTRHILPRTAYLATDAHDLNVHYLSNIFSGNRRVAVRKLESTDRGAFQELANGFDTVLCVNILEKSEQAGTVLENLYAALKPGGALCVLVPQHPKLFNSLDSALLNKRRFSRDDLATLLGSAGFSVERILSFNRVSLPAWWMNGSVLHRKRISKWQLKLFDGLIGLWRRVDAWLPWPGLSLVAVARKPGAASTTEPT